MKPAGIYVSFPFCRQKCTYCNFASDVLPDVLIPRYVRALQTEIAQRTELWQAAGFTAADARKADTVYLGGGTPGMLDADLLRKLLDTIRSEFQLIAGAEITLEASPENATPDSVGGWAAAGVNRVSMGVQSMITEELRAVGRRHDAAAVAEAVRILRGTGIENISFDLIAGLPHQTSESWKENLSRVLELSPTHLSVYMLEIDSDSRLGSELMQGGERYSTEAVPSEEEIAAFYTKAMETLFNAGYLHYEISNFALPGRESLHNEKYWTGAPYFGFGVDAHSYDGTQRWANGEGLTAYLESVEAGRSPVEHCGKLTDQQRLEERFFLGLRRRQGVSLAEISKDFGEPIEDRYGSAIASLREAGWISNEQDRLKLTDSGLLFSNEVFERFLG